uniref:6-pyruvoyltetrahydropterin synthase n=1 Tax=Anolis carolinensis TaxID=28377 RepID=A0A803T9Q1_ANOCA
MLDEQYEDTVEFRLTDLRLSDLPYYPTCPISQPLDKKDLDEDVPYFANVVSTTENIAMFIWENLQKYLSPNKLHKIKLYESETVSVTYKGGAPLAFAAGDQHELPE